MRWRHASRVPRSTYLDSPLGKELVETETGFICKYINELVKHYYKVLSNNVTLDQSTDLIQEVNSVFVKQLLWISIPATSKSQPYKHLKTLKIQGKQKKFKWTNFTTIKAYIKGAIFYNSTKNDEHSIEYKSKN